MKEDSELISVIVPVYNVEKYIERCINSLLEQSYVNIEVILVDDGSKDSSSLLCDKYKEIDARIKVIHKENGGLSDARNVGIKNSTGAYIAFVDSDDYVEQDYIESMYINLKKYNADIAMCNYNIVKNEMEKRNNKIDECIYTYDKVQAINELLIAKTISSHVWNKLYKRNIWEDITFPIGKSYEDLSVMYLVFDKINNLVYSSIPKYNYIMRERKYNPF